MYKRKAGKGDEMKPIKYGESIEIDGVKYYYVNYCASLGYIFTVDGHLERLDEDDVDSLLFFIFESTIDSMDENLKLAYAFEYLETYGEDSNLRFTECPELKPHQVHKIFRICNDTN